MNKYISPTLEIKDQSRFAKFRDKIVHIILDDVDNLDRANTNSRYRFEEAQRFHGWVQIMKWLELKKMTNSSDSLVIHGDVDEVVSRENVHRMRHCELKRETFDVLIWFPFGNIHDAFRSHFPIDELPYSFASPTVRTLETALSENQLPGQQQSKMRSKSSINFGASELSPSP